MVQSLKFFVNMQIEFVQFGINRIAFNGRISIKEFESAGFTLDLLVIVA